MNTQITGRQEFILLVEQMRWDLINDPGKWENGTLNSFLEALAAYATDIQGYYRNINQDVDADVASWQVFADMLLGARVYEL